MEKELKNLDWKEYLVSDLFLIQRGTRITIPTRIKGKMPLVTAGFQNEGVVSLIDNKTQETYSNAITIDMFGNVFYRKYPFKCDDNIHVLTCSDLNEHSGKFICSSIKKTTQNNFNYGKQFRLKTLSKLKVMLPYTFQDKPDYVFMESYIKSIEQEKINTYKSYINKRQYQVEQFNNVKSLSEKKWEEFDIKDIFNIESGKRLTKSDMTKGKMPFIGASDANNGITEYVSNVNTSVDSNVLGVNYNGSVVENFYHPYTALFSDDVKRFSLKNINGNQYLYLFLKTIILNQKNKYKYGYKFNEKRMLKQKIMLPTDANEQPDYDYMENYMKKLEYDKLMNFLSHKP